MDKIMEAPKAGNYSQKVLVWLLPASFQAKRQKERPFQKKNGLLVKRWKIFQKERAFPEKLKDFQKRWKVLQKR
jgi:hypothetical protein